MWATRSILATSFSKKWDTENKSKQTMNTRILSLVLALGLSMGAAVAQKIGHIAMDQLVQLMPETQAAQTEIEAYAQKLETDFQEMQQEYMNLVTDFQEKEAQMTKLSRDNKMQEIQGMQQRIEAYQQKLLTPIIEKANKAIQEVCVEEGFDYVLDSSDSKGVVLAINNSNDITPQVKQKLGI
jgi:outer membrane protein